VGALDAEEVGLEPAARDEDEHRVEAGEEDRDRGPTP
jgi:hypothetical protein